MASDLVVTLEHAVNGHLIPAAIPITIPAGSEVAVCQQLGGSVTVSLHGNLIRIGALEAEKLGLQRTASAKSPTAFSEAAVWEVLKTCFDPEIPVNIVDLGLIYQCQLIPLNHQVTIAVMMTLTAPGCGMGPILVEEIKSKLLKFTEVSQVEVDLVFDPPWTVDRMSDAAKLELGMF